MISKENYESMRFESIINTIYKESYPDHFPMHWHKYVEIISIPEDASENESGMVRLNQKLYELHSGDILFIWPGELHEVVDNQEHTLIALQFPYTVLSEIKDFAIYSNSFRKHHLLQYNKNPEINQTMFFAINQIMELSNSNQKQFRNVEMLISLYEMFISFGNYIHDCEEIADAQKDGTDKMQCACQYIQENCEWNLTLERVSEHVGFSTCYFSRCFKKATGYSFVEYLMMQRVKRMQMLLTNPKLSITDAAYQAGFKSISTLNRIFKQYSGCSPSEYRKYYNASM